MFFPTQISSTQDGFCAVTKGKYYDNVIVYPWRDTILNNSVPVERLSADTTVFAPQKCENLGVLGLLVG